MTVMQVESSAVLKVDQSSPVGVSLESHVGERKRGNNGQFYLNEIKWVLYETVWSGLLLFWYLHRCSSGGVSLYTACPLIAEH